MEVRITTTVVATTSFWLGQVTRPISLRTSERNRRERPHHPVTLSRARPLKESCSSAVMVFMLVSEVRGRGPRTENQTCAPNPRTSELDPRSRYWQDRRESNPQPPVLETGALPIELLS